MAKTNEDILKELQEEASDIRDSNASVKSGLRKKDEDTESSPDTDEPDEQIIETTDEPDEEPEDESRGDDSEEEDAEEKEQRREQKPNFKENALRRIIQKEREQRAELEAKIKEYQAAETKHEQRAISDEIGDLVKEINEGRKPEQQVDGAAIEKMLLKAADIAERRLADRLPPQELYSDFETRQEEAYFEEEWEDPSLQGYIEQAYPRASARQLEEAKALLDELSHDPEHGGRTVIGKDGKERLEGYPLDYIMWKNKSEFDAILNNKKKHGLESASRASMDDTDYEQRDTDSAKGIDALDKKYARLANDSGLHRVRSGQRSI